MRKKLCSSKGMTLTELLVALMIVGLIGVALTVGVNGAAKVYRDSVRLYEAETLCGTILTGLEDEFRFSRNIKDDGTFDSQVFGSGVKVFLADSKVVIGNESDPLAPKFQLLSEKAYTSGLEVEKCDIEPGSGQVTITVTVKSDAAKTSVTHTAKVAPLNS